MPGFVAVLAEHKTLERKMTSRERRWMEYERAHASMRRALLLTLVVLVGALLGYHPRLAPDTPLTVSSSAQQLP